MQKGNDELFTNVSDTLYCMENIFAFFRFEDFLVYRTIHQF